MPTAAGSTVAPMREAVLARHTPPQGAKWMSSLLLGTHVEATAMGINGFVVERWVSAASLLPRAK